MIYNSLVSKRNNVREAWSTIETQLKRRYDLIPNIVSTVKGYAKQESETLTKIVELRSKTFGSGNMEDIEKTENQISSALKTVFALSESYPDLKSSANFIELQKELSDTETKIQSARQFYNSCVLSINTAVDKFPSNIIAKMFSFNKEKYFEVDETENIKQAPKVNF